MSRPAGEADLAVVGIGSMVVDRIRRVRRILAADEKASVLPGEGGAPVEAKVGGVVLNHLGWAAALGLRTGIFGKQADDAEGRFLRAAMDRLGIARDLVLDGAASSTAEIFVDESGGRAIYMAPAATAETTPEHVRTHHGPFIARGRRVSTEVSQLPLATVRQVLELARAAGAETVVDLDLPPSEAVPALGSAEELDAVLRAADLLKPSKSAAAELFAPTGDALEIARAARARFGNAAVVVTDGAAGCAIAAEGFEGRVQAPSVRPVDTTGAGDAFLGGLLAALDRGLGWPDAAALANAAGAACCEKLGAFPDDPDAARARVVELYAGAAPLELEPLPPAVGPEPGAHAAEALATLGVMVEELDALARGADAAVYEAAVSLVLAAEEKHRRVHVTGVGKPEHVARYAASLLSSTGTPATFLHGTEASHGSAGQVAPGDVVIAISNSGDTAELRSAVEAVQGLGARLVAVSGNRDSWLARASEVFLHAGVSREGGGLGLAPRASVAAEVLVVAALAAALERARGFTTADYVARHPAGALGLRARHLDDSDEGDGSPS